MSVLNAFPQAGKSVYMVLNMPMDSRSIGLGGNNVSLSTSDINLAINNPALLSNKCHNIISLNYANYLADINFGSVAYGRSIGENNIGIAVNYLDYGIFRGYDSHDNYQGNFTAKDIVLNILYSRPFGKYFSVGGNLKTVYSAYERYSSAGLAIDIGASFHHSEYMLDMGLTVRNIGFQFYGYQSVEGNSRREPLPLDVVFGISKRLSKAPLSFSLTLHNLQQPNLYYEHDNNSSSQLIDNNKPIKWYDMMFRHAIFATEILPSKNFFISVGFNYRRKAEMNTPQFRSMAGFSLGTGIKVKGFRVGVAMAQMQSGNPTYHFSLSSDIGWFGVK